MVAGPKPSKTATGRAAQRILSGTEAHLPQKIHSQTSSLAIDIVGGAIRLVEWHGSEVLRGQSYPDRNCDWGTSPDQTITETSSPDAAHYARSFVTAGGALDGMFTCDDPFASHAGETWVQTIDLRVSEDDTSLTGLQHAHRRQAKSVTLEPCRVAFGDMPDLVT